MDTIDLTDPSKKNPENHKNNSYSYFNQFAYLWQHVRPSVRYSYIHHGCIGHSYIYHSSICHGSTYHSYVTATYIPP
ncbi:hypothetical protein C8034_v004746 [Colletotrichum sidae]|uniref:Uncharacterized protein n=1 Tax=Colletotrichum sidae TaxID=1347389 RepID=A0A4R8S184_9PEZI|nr:hypothetical protein C8034_v004746 [Colletotrichum sidae]